MPPATLKKSLDLRLKLHDHKWKTYQHWPSNGQSEEVAAAILFLVSDAASLIPGACIPVDGGASGSGPNLGGAAGTGVAMTMIQWTIDTARAAGQDYLRLDCAPRPRLCSFYENAGFHRHSERQIGRYTLVRYQMALDPHR